MLKEFTAFIKQNDLITANDKVLLTISGGIDSVVMAELFSRAGFDFAIAHCNFSLRGDESDAEALFVKDLAIKKYKKNFFTKRFDTALYSKQNKLSIQEAARNLRYEWFEEIMSKHGFDYIATAHHRDDQIETFFINLLRGTGISGLTGISIKQNHIIRPLLFAKRDEIVDFANKAKIPFRTDSSNASNKYLRNKIRHKLIPLLESLNPQFSDTITNSIFNLKNTETIYRKYLEQISPVEKTEAGQIVISIKNLLKLIPLPHFLFEYISQYGFNITDCYDICKSLSAISGKQFFSKTHCLLIDREKILIEPLNPTYVNEVYIIEEETKSLEYPIKLKISTIHNSNNNLNSGKNTAMIDFDKVKFPLILRKWGKGDYFCPLGMKSRKKLSDFFIDNKISRFEKSKIWLLCSQKKIVWIVGYRLDERFKVEPRTNLIYKIVSLE